MEAGVVVGVPLYQSYEMAKGTFGLHHLKSHVVGATIVQEDGSHDMQRPGVVLL